MSWGSVELEPEVEEWVLALADEPFGHVERSIDLLAEQGVHLGEPFTRQLQGKLRRMTPNSWEAIKSQRRDSPARRRGHEKAGRAIRLAMEIHSLREKRGLSQRELAERLGTTQSAIARLEGGHVSPSLPTLDKIAGALGVELIVSFVDLNDQVAG